MSESSTATDQTDSATATRKTPVVILVLLVAANVGISFAPLRPGSAPATPAPAIMQVLPVQAWFSSVSHQQLFLQLLLLLVLIPSAIVAFALPLKLRDRQFQLGLVFQMGLFVAFIFAIQMMRIKAG